MHYTEKRKYLYIFLWMMGWQYLSAQNTALWYAKPAVNFNEALPIGNGRMGAMVYGRVKAEYISLNEQTLWSGGPDITWNNPAAKKYLQPVREAALADNYKRADSLAKFMQGPYTESYLPMADLHLLYDGITDSVAYKRTLNMDSALCTTVFTSGGTNFTRTFFASFPDKVLVIRNTADKKAAISFRIILTSKLHYTVRTTASEMILSGKCPKHVEPAYRWKIKDSDAVQYAGDEGMFFEVRLRVQQQGGRLTADDSGLSVQAADAVTILISAATSFNGFDTSPARNGKDPSAATTQCLQATATKSYAQLLTAHIKDYQPLFNRVSYQFGNIDMPALPTDERLKRMGERVDPGLLSMIVQYGRYLLIASSRPGGQPSNLKGLWNERLRAEYSANWCIDHDAQMFYYPVETTNLSELHAPFLQLIQELSENGYKTASVNYGMQGWCAHHNTDIWRKSSPAGNWGEGNPHWANWNMSGAWLSRHYFEHYLFTGDKTFLANKAWPVMKGAALFCLNWLMEDSAGHLVSVPSVSPENTFITDRGDTAQISVNATSDIELIKDLFSNCMAAANALHIKDTFTDAVKTAYGQLASYPIGPGGQLLEWQHDWKAMDPGHRHLSHMYAVYPGSEISPVLTPALAEAAKKALTLRQKTNGSWGFAWKAACWARLYEGDSASQTLQYQLRYVDALSTSSVNNYGLYPNLFNSEVPYAILNGNACITAAVTEMLLQSHTGFISFLPALPGVLKTGSVSGLCATNGFEVSLQWQNGRLVKATLLSKTGSDCRVLFNEAYAVYCEDKKVALKEAGDHIFSFQTVKGKSYTLTPR